MVQMIFRISIGRPLGEPAVHLIGMYPSPELLVSQQLFFQRKCYFDGG